MIYAPFFAALLLLPLQRWFALPMRVLLAAAAAGAWAFCLTNIGGGLEYKLVFAVAVLLAPFVGAAYDLRARTRASQTFVVSATILMLWPALSAMKTQQSLYPDVPMPVFRDSSFYLELAAGEPQKEWIDVVRKETPLDTILVVQSDDRYLPGLAARSWWVAPDHPQIAGYWFHSKGNLLQQRGYSRELYDHRRFVLARLFGPDVAQFPDAVREVRKLDRPVAVILAPGEARELRVWLATFGESRRIYGVPGHREVWLLFGPAPPSPPR